jgi:hypothetical protein
LCSHSNFVNFFAIFRPIFTHFSPIFAHFSSNFIQFRSFFAHFCYFSAYSRYFSLYFWLNIFSPRNASAVFGFLAHPQHGQALQNFTVKEYHVEVPAGEEATLSYEFTPRCVGGPMLAVAGCSWYRRIEESSAVRMVSIWARGCGYWLGGSRLKRGQEIVIKNVENVKLRVYRWCDVSILIVAGCSWYRWIEESNAVILVVNSWCGSGYWLGGQVFKNNASRNCKKKS